MGRTMKKTVTALAGLALCVVLATFGTASWAWGDEGSTSISVSVHQQDIGWTDEAGSGEIAGDTGSDLRIEAIELSLSSDLEGSISYSVDCVDFGWTSGSDGEMAGTTGQSEAISAIKIHLEGEVADSYDIWYRVWVDGYGWTGWTHDGLPAGTTSSDALLEGIEVVLLPEGSSAPGDVTPAVITSSFGEEAETNTEAAVEGDEEAVAAEAGETTAEEAEAAAATDETSSDSVESAAAAEESPEGSDENSSETDETMVYVTDTGTKYHSSASCTGLNNSNSTRSITLDSALEQGYDPCSICYPDAASSSDSSSSETSTTESSEETVSSDSTSATENSEDADATIVYITATGSKYHSSTSCSGLSNANGTTAITEEEAIAQGYEPCKKCW